MRAASLAVALTLAAASVPLGARPAAAASLNAQIDSLASAFDGGAAIWVADPAATATQPLYARDPDHQVIAASLYKLAVLAEAEHQVDLGHLRYEDTIVIEPEDVTLDGSFEAPGTDLTVDEALEQMITVSDNGTAMHFWRMLGPSNINALLQKGGMPDFHVAQDEEDDNVATVRSVGTFLTLLAKRQLVSAAASDRMLKRLERQQINDRIPAQLPEGTVVAHKTGNLPGLVHDAGIVFTPRGPRVLVALTWYADDDLADAFIAHLAAAVYAAVIAPPASVRYRVPSDAQYAEVGTMASFSVTLENAGDEAWTATGPGRVGLTWELRDGANVVARAPGPLPLGQVPPGGIVSVPLVISLPSRAGDHKVVVGLVDASGRALAAQGVATASFAVRVHLPFVAEADDIGPGPSLRRQQAPSASPTPRPSVSPSPRPSATLTPRPSPSPSPAR